MISIVGLMATSKRDHAKTDLPGLLLPVPHPCDETLLIPPTLAGSFGSVSCGVSALFFWVLMHTRFWLCPPRLESLFSPVLWKSCNQIPVAFEVRFPRIPSSFVRSPGGKPDMGFRTFTIVGKFLWHYCSPVCGHPPTGMRLEFIMIVPLLPCHCGFFFVFGCGVSFFGGFQNLPIDGYSTASCNFGALAGGDEHSSFYLPSPV